MLPPYVHNCHRVSYTFIAYCRKSSKEKSRQSASISDQKSTLKELEAREHLSIASWLEEAHSAKSPNTRPVFRSMIDQILAGKADSILCWHLNRLARNPLEGGELQWLLQEGKICCIKTPEREYHPEDHALLMAVESSMAAQYVRDLKRDVERGAREKAERGWYPYRAKVGYIIDPITKEVVVDPDRFLLLRRAWEDLLTGAYSVPQVLESLTASGFRLPRTKKGSARPISRSSLYRLFSDRFYAGFFTYDGVERTGRHEPMVTAAEFSRVQKLLGHAEHAKEQTYFHAYAGFIRCGVCGCRVTAETHVKRYKTTGQNQTYIYYHCTGRRGCPKTSVLESDLEATILDRLEGCRPEPFFADWALSVLEREEREANGADAIRLSVQPQAITTLSRKIDRLFDMREEGEISATEFKERKARYQQDLNTIEAETKESAERPAQARVKLREFLVFTKDAYERFTGGDPMVKRIVAGGFAESYVLTLGNLTINPKPGHDRIRTFEPQKNRAQQIDSDDPGASNPDWRALLDELRTLITDSMRGEGEFG